MAGAEPTAEDWVARYNNPGRGDGANAIAIDAAGNVYVTGWSDGDGVSYDYATVKYDADGNELWVKRYNGPGNGYDYASAIAVDASGNVYVTGWSDGDGTYRDYATVKYDTRGNELWVKRYNGPGNGYDYARAIAVDASKNVYVTGWSDGTGTYRDYATVKYDADGNELWAKRYNGSGNGDDSAIAIAVDASGNIYVTGESAGSGTGSDYATVKYDTEGHQLWVARYNGPGNDSDEANAITLEGSGNVYVTGTSYDSVTNHDYATVKYDTDGNELWVNRYNSPENNWDEAHGIAVDPSDNVYVTGGSPGSGTGSDYATVKYDSEGHQLWVARYNGPGNGSDYAGAIAVDVSGNVYVTGYSPGTGTDDDYATIKYDTDGNELWVKRYNGPGNNLDWALAIAVDTLENVYVTGWSEGIETGYDYATVKYEEVGQAAVQMALLGGWSMISLPVRPVVATVATLFPEAVMVYKYQIGMGYVPVAEDEELKVGMGYWILLDNPQSYVIRGTAITEYTIPVVDRWYMIGGCTLAARGIVTNGRIDLIYDYTQGVGYTRLPGLNPLEPGKGYWILLSHTSDEGAKFMATSSVSQ